MATLLVMYGVLMRMSVGSEARRGGKEVLEWTDVDGGVEYRGWERSG